MLKYMLMMIFDFLKIIFNINISKTIRNIKIILIFFKKKLNLASHKRDVKFVFLFPRKGEY